MTREQKIQTTVAMRLRGVVLSKIGKRVGWCTVQVSRVVRRLNVRGPREQAPKRNFGHIVPKRPVPIDEAKAAAITAEKRAYWESLERRRTA